MKQISVTLVSRLGTWKDVRSAARNTVSKSLLRGPEVTEQMKRSLLMSEHSPIRLLNFLILIENLPSWVSVHLVRHGAGVEPFVSTQRDDRTGSQVPRGKLLQEAPVRHMMAANAQALVNIARRRECFNASPETTSTVRRIQSLLREEGEPELADVMVPECVYRGFCSESTVCKSRYAWTPKFKRDVAAYRATIGRE